MADSVQSTSKRLCLSNDKGGQKDIDRISDLPYSVLCHILSFLPTKMSVATGILSKRWLDLWTVVPVLSFSSTDPRNINFRMSSRFVDSVYKVLVMCRAQTIRQFSLDCKPNSTVDEEHLRTWVSAVIRRNVQELKLNFCRPHVRLPGNVFACKTLVSLELFHHVFVDVPAEVRFQSLRILRLERVRYVNDDSLSRLLSSCPTLEDLTVERIYDDNILVLDIRVPSLKGITVKRPSSETRYDVREYKLLINAPLLERIELKDENCRDFLVEDLPNLVEATIEVYVLYDDENRVFRLLEEMGNVKFLSLSEYTIRSICFPKAIFPVFRNLVYLEIKTSCQNWHGLVALLECSDNLKTFVFHSIPMYHTGRKCGQSLPECVPKCVSMSLKTLKLTGFFNQECDWKLVRYILKNAKFLKRMKIGISFCLKKRRHLLKNLLKYPRASMECEIGFFFDSSNQEIHLCLK